MDALIGTFHIDWKLMVAQLVNFAIVFVVLYIFALRPLGKLMRERSERIDKGIKDADVNAQLVAEAKKVYDAELARGRQEAHTLVQNMHKEVDVKRQEMVAQAQVESERILSEGKKRLEDEKNRTLRDAEKEIAAIVVSGVEKMLRQHVDSETQRDSVIKSIKNIH